MARKYQVNTAIYILKYIQTLDAAVGHAGSNQWVLPMRGGQVHLPFLCGDHLMTLRNTDSTKDRLMMFKAIDKSQDLVEALSTTCKCHVIASSPSFATMTPYIPSGVYFRSNLGLLVEKVRAAAPEVSLAPYTYEIDGLESESESEADEADDYEALKQTAYSDYRAMMEAKKKYQSSCKLLILASSKKQKQ